MIVMNLLLEIINALKIILNCCRNKFKNMIYYFFGYKGIEIIVFIGGVIDMTKKEFAIELCNKLKKEGNVRDVVNLIRRTTKEDSLLSKDEQLEIADLIEKVYIEQKEGLFESVDAFLALVSQVKEEIKSQSNSQSEGNNNGDK